MTESFPFDLLPAPVWKFVGLCSEVTEAPDEFLAASGLFVASVLSGRWVEFNGQALNNYFLMVGETGTAKKTTSQSYAIKLLRDVLHSNPDTHFIVASPESCTETQPLEGPETAYPLITHFSIEGLQHHAMGTGTSTGITMGEYASLFKIDGRQGQQNTVSELTNMYDGNPIAVSTVQRKVDASDYSISIVAGSTKVWLREFLDKKNIGGGFVNRHLVFTGTPERIMPVRSKIDPERWEHIVEQFDSMIPRDLRGLIEGNRVKWVGTTKVVTWSLQAKNAWTRHYTTRIKEMRELTSDSELSELSARELTHTTKLAGLRCHAEGRSEVSCEDLVFGIRVARWATRNVIELAKPHKYFSDQLSKRIIEKIENFKPISKTDLARKLGGKQDEINRKLEHLITDQFVLRLDGGMLMPGPEILNYRDSDIEKYFGKTDVSNWIENVELNPPGINSSQFSGEAHV